MVSYKIGVCKVSPNGKDCYTEFERVSFNGTSSVVLCRPRTGRMHQIRVHLQFLGEYIVLMYTAWGGRLCKRFCNMFSGSSHCLLGQHGSCSSAQLPVELWENMYSIFNVTQL